MINPKAEIMISILVVVFFGAVAQYFAKMYHETKEIQYLIYSGSSFSFGVLALYYPYMYHKEHIWLLNALWSLLSIIAIYIVGYIYWGETLTNKEMISAVLIVFGTGLIYL